MIEFLNKSQPKLSSKNELVNQLDSLLQLNDPMELVQNKIPFIISCVQFYWRKNNPQIKSQKRSQKPIDPSLSLTDKSKKAN